MCYLTSIVFPLLQQSLFDTSGYGPRGLQVTLGVGKCTPITSIFKEKILKNLFWGVGSFFQWRFLLGPSPKRVINIPSVNYKCKLFQWCETQRDCNRLRLVDILVIPMQRITKYSLLLKAVLKNTDDPNQRHDLIEMVRNATTGLKCSGAVITVLKHQQLIRGVQNGVYPLAKLVGFGTSPLISNIPCL